MKKLVLICTLATLAACQQAAAPASDTEEAAEPAEAGMIAWQADFPDGTKGVTVATADGRYYHARGNFESGTMTNDEEAGTACFTAEGAAEPACVTVKDEGDGNYSLTQEDGGTITTHTIN